MIDNTIPRVEYRNPRAELRLVQRREALRLFVSAAAISVLAACGPAAPAPAAATQAPAKPAPTPASAAASAPTSAPAAPTPAVQATAAQAAQPKPGGTLTAGMIGDLGSIEGHQVTQATVNVTFLAYDRLIEYDDKLTAQPMLAESWDISSDLKQ